MCGRDVVKGKWQGRRTAKTSRVSSRACSSSSFRVAYRILGRAVDAEDVAAETLARTLIAWQRVGGQSYEVAWVVRLATNRAIDVARRGRHLGLQPERVAVDPEETATLRVALVAALDGLSRRQRQVVALRYLAGLSEHDVAAALGISPNSVKKHAVRGVSSLRARLGVDWEGPQLVPD